MPGILWKKCGAPGETRTPNLLIRSQMLYPLSYGRVSHEATERAYQSDEGLPPAVDAAAPPATGWGH